MQTDPCEGVRFFVGIVTCVHLNTCLEPSKIREVFLLGLILTA